MPELTAFAVFVLAWCVLLLGPVLVGVWRVKRFESVLASSGFVQVDANAYTADIFAREHARLSRVVSGSLCGTRITFLFGSCCGHPIALEGIFVVPRVQVAAALIETTEPHLWIETWTTERARQAGWRRACAASLMADGRLLLVWDNFSQQGASFKRCCLALARTGTYPTLQPRQLSPEARR